MRGAEIVVAAAATAHRDATQAVPAASLVLFPILFVGMWLLVSTLLAFLGGHTSLLARFPPVKERLEETFRSASGHMRWVSFRGALFVGIGPRGLHLAPGWLWRPIFGRGIPCVPWTEVRLVRPQGEGVAAWFVGSKLEIPAVNLRFSLHGKAGRAVEQKLATAAGPPPLPSSRRLVREV